MNTSELTTVVREAVASVLGHDLDTLNVDERLADLGADSLDLVDIELHIESELGITVPDQFAQHDSTVTSMVKAISEMEGVLD